MRDNPSGSREPSLRGRGSITSSSTPAAWISPKPLRFHNGHLEDIKGRFRASARVPLPELPGFFPAGATGDMTFQGRDVFHLDSALRGQPLFSHLEALRILVQKAAGRRLAFPEFLSEINRIPIPAEWRNEIVNSLFDNAQNPPASPQADQSKVGRDLDRILEMFREGDGGGTAVNPNLGRFLDEVGRDSTGFILKDAAAQALLQDLTKTLETLRGGLLRHGTLSSALGFLASLQRLARLAKGRDRQTVHLWSDVPDDAGGCWPRTGTGPCRTWPRRWSSSTPSVAKPDSCGAWRAWRSAWNAPCSSSFPARRFRRMAPAQRRWPPWMPACRRIPISSPAASPPSWMATPMSSVPRPWPSWKAWWPPRQPVSAYLHRSMVLEDQDVITEKGQARAADRLLDQSQIDALAQRRVNRVNSVRNRTEAVFPLLSPWKDQ